MTGHAKSDALRRLQTSLGPGDRVRFVNPRRDSVFEGVGVVVSVGVRQIGVVIATTPGPLYVEQATASVRWNYQIGAGFKEQVLSHDVDDLVRVA